MVPKFRVFEKERKIMCEVEELVFKENGDLRQISYYWEDYGEYYGEYLTTTSLDDLILMQSTGLIDKNGTEIFEGDVVLKPGGEIGEVTYLIQEAGFVVKLKNRDYHLGHEIAGEQYAEANEHKVIGHIHESREVNVSSEDIPEAEREYKRLEIFKEGGYEWVSRDGDGLLKVHEVKPVKYVDRYHSWGMNQAIPSIGNTYDILIEGPCKIDDLLEMYEGSVREVPFLARKKPVEVEAIEYTGFNLGRCLHFVGGVGLTSDNTPPPLSTLTIETLEGNMTVNRGDYIIKGVEGEFYPINPDIFHKTYDIL